MAVLAIHTLCCGAPFALVLFGAGANAGLLGAQVTIAHGMMHHFELWVLAVSLGLVVLGGALEWRRRKERAFPVLFVLSIACLALNASIVFGHSGPIDAKGLELFSWAHAAHGSN
jgi:hypothetical protein